MGFQYQGTLKGILLIVLLILNRIVSREYLVLGTTLINVLVWAFVSWVAGICRMGFHSFQLTLLGRHLLVRGVDKSIGFI